MKQYMALVLALGWLASQPAIAQDEKIKADRPGLSVSPELAGKGILIAEAGFERQQQQKEAYAYQHPDLSLRFGLSQKFELRAALTAETQKNRAANEFRYGLKPVELGFKAMLWEEKGALPAISLYTQVGMGELAAKDHKTKHVYPEIRLLFQNRLSDKWKLEYNVGPEWNGDASQPQWFYAVGPEVEIGEKVEAFLEAFGRLQKGAMPEHQLDGGLAWYPTNNIKLDISAGLGLSRAAPDYFVAVGLSFQLKP